MFFHRHSNDPKAGEWLVDVGATRLVALVMVALGTLLFVTLLRPDLISLPLPPDLAAYLGLFLFKGGLLGFFSVMGITVDLRARAVFRWVRILGLRALESRTKIASLEDECTGVRVDPDPLDLVVTRHHGWTVRLLPGSAGGQRIERFATPLEALELARNMAAFLAVPLADASMGPEREVLPPDLHAPLCEILRRRDAVRRKAAEEWVSTADEPKGRMGDGPEPPPSDALRPVRLGGGRWSIVLPPGGLRGSHVAAVLLGGLLSVAFFLFLRPWESGMDLPVFLAALAVVLWPLPLPLAVALVATRQETHLRVDEDGLHVERPWGFARISRSLVHGELRDLLLLEPAASDPSRGFVFPSDGMVVARGERRMLRFGAGLSRDELRWLHHELERVIATHRER